jgi:hypothetical protein
MQPRKFRGPDARVMATTKSRSEERKKVRFPPPKAWDPEAKWIQECVIFQDCGEMHSQARCDIFITLSLQQRLRKIDGRELYWLCYRHLQGRECWSQGRVPNCGVDSCEAPHHPLLHSALVEGRVMVVQGIGNKKAQVHLCREDVRVEVAGKTSCLHTLYDWGATVTLMTHAAAKRAGLKRTRQTPSVITGLSGECTMVDSHYMVPVVDGDDKVRTMKAIGVSRITTVEATDMPADIEKRFPQARGYGNKLVRPAKDLELLIGMDNQGWMPKHIGSI